MTETETGLPAAPICRHRRKVLVVIRLYSRRITQSPLTNRRERKRNDGDDVNESTVTSAAFRYSLPVLKVYNICDITL